METQKLQRRFAEILDPDAVLVDDLDEEYASDYTEEAASAPALVLQPSSTEQLQAVVKLAAELGCSLTVRVAGSNVGGLALAPEGGVVLNLTRMNRILEINEQDMYALIEPGVTWEQLKEHLEQEQIPLRMGYPLSPPDTSILANCILDGLGNLSMRFGSMAEWIGGLEAVLPDGQLVRTGAAAGSDVWFARGPLPDLTGLFVCWQGMTGIVSKLAFQLQPTPEFQQRAFILMYDRNFTFQAMRDLARLQICDDVGGLSWPTGKMLFGVERPTERDPAEPEFFLYLDITGRSERELALRLEMLDSYLDRLQGEGAQLEKPLKMETLIKLNPNFAKFAVFPTRLEFLVDHSGGGLSWVGTYGPMSRFEQYADAALPIMERHKMPPSIVSRPMKGGHFGVMRFLSTFQKQDRAECENVRAMNAELVDAGMDLGFIPYKTPPWTVEQIRHRLDPGYVKLLGRVRQLLDPQKMMSQRCWPLGEL